MVVDLVETFNYLIGLRVQTLSARQHLTAEFARDVYNKLTVTRTLPVRRGKAGASAKWKGRRPRARRRSSSGAPSPTTRKRTTRCSDYYFERMAYSTRDREFNMIYVNGDNNLENLRRDDETWKVRVIEADFHRFMFDVQDV